MTGNCHVRCGVGENSKIVSKSYLSLLLVFRFIEQEVINAREKNKGGANLHTLIIADEAHPCTTRSYVKSIGINEI